MSAPDATGPAAWLATTDPATLTALALAGTIALGGLLYLTNMAARRATAGARARAAERARLRVEVWAADRAMARRRRARLRYRARQVARSFMDTPRARRALLAVVLVTALAATVLSAHGIQDALGDARLNDWWVRVCGFIAFEGFLLAMFVLSWWHRTTSQEGFDIYGAFTWAGSGLLALVGYHGGGDWLYAVFAPLAALGFHLTAGAERRRRGGAPSWAARAATAARARIEAALVWLGRTPTSADTNARDAERRRARVAARAVKARRAGRFTKGARERAFHRAVSAAAARGLLDNAGRAIVTELVAVRLTALDALTNAALATDTGLWAAPSAPVPEPERAPERASAPTLAPTVETESAPRPARAETAPARPRVSQRDPAIAWCVEQYAANGEMPSGPEVGARFGTVPGNARKWIATARERAAA